MDGTLVDSTPVFYTALAAYLTRLGMPHTLQTATRDFFALSMAEVHDKIQNNIAIARDEFIAEIGAQYRSVMPGNLRAAPHAKNFIEHAQSRGIKTSVASNGEMENILATLHHIGFSKLFGGHEIFSAEQVARPKPAPDLYELASTGYNKTNILVIEDSKAGITAAKQASLRVWGYTGLGENAQTAQKLALAGADAVFGNWRDLTIAADAA